MLFTRNKNVRFAALLTVAVGFSVLAWTGAPSGRPVWLGLSVVFLVLAIVTRRRVPKCGSIEMP